jgi:hypothetical protein
MVEPRARRPSRRILIDLGHPAQFHLFRHAAERLLARGDEVVLLARQKDCLLDLLAGSGLPYVGIPRPRRSFVALAGECVRALGLACRLARPRPFDVLMGSSVVIGPAARLTGGTSVVFCEDDADAVPLFARLAYATAHHVATPDSLRRERLGRKHLTYPGYHELAYLHPDLFTPDPDIREELGLPPGRRYFLLRLVAMGAHHDVGQRGLDRGQVARLVETLSAYGQVFVSSEADLAPSLAALRLPTGPDRIHQVLASADLLIADSQSMTMEAAVLGVPSLRCNTFAGRLSVLEELEHRYGLTRAYRPEQFEAMLAELKSLLARPDLRRRWQARRQAMLAGKTNVTEWILGLVDRLSGRR